MRDLIISKLKAKGYDVEPYDVSKNGVIKKGIKLSTMPVAPIFYPDSNKTVRETIALIEEILKQKAPVNDADIDRLTDWDYIKNRIIICVQKQTNEKIEKENFLEFECYLRVLINYEMSYKVTSSLMETLTQKVGNADTIWETAYINTKNMLDINDLEDINESLNESIKSFNPEIMLKNSGIIYNNLYTELHFNYPSFGAIAIIFTDVFRYIVNELNHDLIIMPISTDSLLLTPKLDDNISCYSEVLREVSKSTILEEYQLSNHAYIMRIGAEGLEMIP